MLGESRERPTLLGGSEPTKPAVIGWLAQLNRSGVGDKSKPGDTRDQVTSLSVGDQVFYTQNILCFVGAPTGNKSWVSRESNSRLLLMEQLVYGAPHPGYFVS